MLVKNEIARDERTLSYVMPEKILFTKGHVKNEELFLKARKSIRIHIDESETVLFQNASGGEHASVLLDFGREFCGGIRILAHRQPTGTSPKMLVRFGESVVEALTPVPVDNAGNDHAVREFSIKLPVMSDQTWGQTGFRYVYLELLEDNTFVTLKQVLAAFVFRDIPYLGSFRCSDEVLNRIFDVSAYTCHLCMQNHLWDGIKRDRLIWVGDFHTESLTVRSVFGNDDLIEKTLREALDLYPLPGWMQLASYSLWWIMILYDRYTYNGHIGFLRENREYLLGLTRQIGGLIDENGNLKLPQYFLDHTHVNTPEAVCGVSALAVMAMRRASLLLKDLGEDEGAGYASTVSEKIRPKISDIGYCKAAMSLALLAGLVSDREAEKVLTSDGYNGISTFLSLYYLQALSRIGRIDYAAGFMRGFFGRMLEMGATTFWESFELPWAEDSCPIDRIPKEGEKSVHASFGAGCYKGLRNSLCHGWSSGCAPFLLETVLGIHVSGVTGEIFVSPRLGDLSFAEGTYPLPDGRTFSVRAEKQDGMTAVRVDAPEDCKVHVNE